jgi:thiol-disulfide isomerase/thioredoxin
MNNFIKIFLITLFLSNIFYAQEERKTLVEIFTNSHCPLCPPGHNALESYDQNSPNAEKISYIVYHMIYPYSDDVLYRDNEDDSDGRDLYYGPFGSTPKAFFDGMIQQNNYSSWGSLLDQKVGVASPLKINLTGTKGSGNININAEITRSGNIAGTDLVIHFVVVENIFYQGRNGITLHRNVMRSMVTSPNGESFTIGENETKQVQKSINLSGNWIPDSLGVVVFIQNNSTKEVYQSDYISYSELELTGVDIDTQIPSEYSLEQNYPNPFNPSTRITYSILKPGFVSIKVYNVLGKEITTLVNEVKQEGKHVVDFNSESIPGSLTAGVYFYKLETDNFVSIRKMILLK